MDPINLPTKPSLENERQEGSPILKVNFFLQNTQFLNSNQHTWSTLPRYTYTENKTLHPSSTTTNDHTIIDSGTTNTFILVNTKVKDKTPNLRPFLVIVPNR